MKIQQNNKRLSKAVIMGTAMVSLSSVVVLKAQAATATGSMSAEVLRPLEIGSRSALNFGGFTEAAGTITVHPDGSRTSGSTHGLMSGTADHQAGVMKLMGAPGTPIVVSMAASTYTLEHTGSGASLQVKNFNIRTNGGGTSEQITMAGTNQDVPVGATLTVQRGQTFGQYNGTYTIFANYQ